MLKSTPKQKHLPMISIVGVDGSGKSTVLSAIQQNFNDHHVCDVHILNRVYKKSAQGKPVQNYAQPPHSALYSVTKLFYLAFLWIIHYYFNVLRMKRNGTLILCDHFYFLGTTLDPLKYRYGGPDFLLKWVLRVIPQPDLYIFLDAPLEVVYERKQEASPQEMELLISKHREYMSEIPNSCMIDATKPVDQVVADVSEKIEQLIEQL